MNTSGIARLRSNTTTDKKRPTLKRPSDLRRAKALAQGSQGNAEGGSKLTQPTKKENITATKHLKEPTQTKVSRKFYPR